MSKEINISLDKLKAMTFTEITKHSRALRNILERENEIRKASIENAKRNKRGRV